MSRALEETPYALQCWKCGKVCLTELQYLHQLDRPDDRWCCPRCGEEAEWDDAHYEEYLEEREP